jgi:hypothetical protein
LAAGFKGDIMQIKLSPTRSDEQLIATITGDTITLNDESFDLSPLKDGESIPSDAIGCKWICGDVERIDGEISLTLMLPHGANAPEETRFPKNISVIDGLVPLPLYDVVEEVEPEQELTGEVAND